MTKLKTTKLNKGIDVPKQVLPKKPKLTIKPPIICPKCKRKNSRNKKVIIKKGKIKSKHKTYQRYQCKQCSHIFTQQPPQEKQKTYPLKIILTAISNYNLGHSSEKTKTIINRRFKTQITAKTINNWVNQFKQLLPYTNIRTIAKNLYLPEKIIFKKPLFHKQIYKFQLHKAKLELTAGELSQRKFQLLKSYLSKIPTKEFPHHIFQGKHPAGLKELSRSSQMKFKTLRFTKLEKQNQANQLARLALSLAKTNRERHQAIQDFMLINDSTTIATEVPVYLTNDDIKYFKSKGFTLNLGNYQTPITGHIDILQLRNHLIHILDYKPEASKTNPINQLTTYALALASRTKLALKDFKCTWFDDKNYYEFFPLHAVYPK